MEKRSGKRGSRIRFPEQLERREMLSGLAAGAALPQKPMGVPPSGGTCVAPPVPKPPAPPIASQQTALGGQLTDASNASAMGMAMYRTRTVNGVTSTELMVDVRGATASSKLDVSIGGIVVGQVTTDSNGNGRLVLSSNPKNTNELPLPANFPATVAAGTAVSVGTLSGSLAAPPITPVKPPPGPAPSQGTVLGVQLSDPANQNAMGLVVYRTRTINGVTTTDLMVDIRGAAASSTLDVTLGGVVIGQVTTDSNGNGRLILSSNPKNANEQPLPANFPTTVDSGMAVTVGTLGGNLGTLPPPPVKPPLGPPPPPPSSSTSGGASTTMGVLSNASKTAMR